MASVFELAKLPSMVYGSTKTVFQGWVRWSYHGDPIGKNFYSEFYLNHKKSEAVYVVRGTDVNGGWGDYIADLQIGLGRVPHQFAEVDKGFETLKSIAKRILRDNYKIYLTGHSLGGGLASLVSAKQGGFPTVTSNAPGMMHSYAASHGLYLFGLYKMSKLDTSKMLHMRATGDPASIVTGKHMGRMEEVYVDEWGGGKVLSTSRHAAQHSEYGQHPGKIQSIP